MGKLWPRGKPAPAAEAPMIPSVAKGSQVEMQAKACFNLHI